jgi:LuxR family transcriptional regulator, quorum-sensing system regulator BjaR1
MVTPRSGRRHAKRNGLTARETEVLRWVANGKSAVEIGGILKITKRTVDEHVQTAVRKLGAHNRTHAVALALRDGVIIL